MKVMYRPGISRLLSMPLSRPAKAEYVKDSEGNNVLDPNGNPIQESKGGWGWGSLNIGFYRFSLT